MYTKRAVECAFDIVITSIKIDNIEADKLLDRLALVETVKAAVLKELDNRLALAKAGIIAEPTMDYLKGFRDCVLIMNRDD